MICWLPDMTSTSSVSRTTWKRRLTKRFMASRVLGTPSETEYWSIPTGSDSRSSAEKRAMASFGNESAAGLPPAKLMSVGSPICLRISRMTEGFMPAMRSEMRYSILLHPFVFAASTGMGA